MSCSVFASLQEHAQRILRDKPPSSETEADVVELLEQAVRAKLLVSANDILRAARSNAGSSTPVRLESIAIVTKDRPGALLRCLRSLSEDVRAAGRRARFTIVDSSARSDARPSLSAAATTEARLGAPARYLGVEDKARLSRRLAKASSRRKRSARQPRCIPPCRRPGIRWPVRPWVCCKATSGTWGARSEGCWPIWLMSGSHSARSVPACSNGCFGARGAVSTSLVFRSRQESSDNPTSVNSPQTPRPQRGGSGRGISRAPQISAPEASKATVNILWSGEVHTSANPSPRGEPAGK